MGFSGPVLAPLVGELAAELTERAGYGLPRRGFAPPRNDGARNLAPPVGELSAQLTERAVPMIIFP